MEKNKITKQAINWLLANKPSNINPNIYCQTRDVFIGRLDKLRLELDKKLSNSNLIPLIIAIIGEIGNNSFDHNLGKWRDIPGIFFAYDLSHHLIVLADRGQGIKKTISQIKPEVKNDPEALRVAFTEMISGRAPEHRGNGLKFVAKVVIDNKFALSFQSGRGLLEINQPNYQLNFAKTDTDIKGTLAIIKF